MEKGNLLFCHKIAAFLLFLELITSFCEASEFRFGLQRSTEWQFTGRKVRFNFTMEIPESTPLKAKIKLPFNGTAILRLTEAAFTFASEQLTTSNNTTKLTSSGNDSLHDIAMFNFGNVTRASSENSTELKINFEVQVMNHAHVVNGGKQWVSLGVEYKNHSIWASQMAIQTVNPASSKPDLKVEIWPDLGYQRVVTNDTVDLRLRLSHSDLTTEEVVSGIIEWPLPPVLSLHSCVQLASSVEAAVTKTTDMVTIKFGQLKFSEWVDLRCTFNLDKHKTNQDGKIHDCTTHVVVRYNGSINTCSSSSGSREFTNEEPATVHFKYYVKQSSCDDALGMEARSISNDQITASSYANGAPPHEGRMGGKGWVPHGELKKDKHQFLEVNFTSRVKIRRISTKGADQNFVRSFRLYYSDDGIIWTPYKQGSKIKEFPANYDGKSVANIILPVPFKAVFVRINPVSWENSISLKIELYGCDLKESRTAGPLAFTSRGYLLDTERNIMYVCSMPMESKQQSSKCFFSSDDGRSWKSMYYGVISLLGHDKVENVLYGVSLNGKAVMRSSTDHSAKFVGVPLNTWEEVKAKDTTTRAVHIGRNDFTISDDTTPTQIDGTKWGVSAKGIHVKESSSPWILKAIWMCTNS
ncbi:uncharacterized protein [Montipora foliosa]|uniref:uncharacterized protein isoform X1 n=2 Tax=Montipora foliosa TaxID=591990 RepID=UPI0035F1C462